MVRPACAASAVLALLSAANALTIDPEAPTLALNFQKRAARDSSPASGLARRSGTVAESLTWGQLLYYINLTLGTPPQPAAVWLDTGSSDLWLPDTGSNICNASPGCSDNGGFNPAKSSSYKTLAAGKFQISYASGDSIVGDYGQDKLSMDNADISNMIFGVARKGQTSEPLSGIMGVGYALGESIVQTSPDQQTYPTIIDNLVTSGIINTHSYSLYLNDLDNGHGTILFGGVDTDKYSGELGIVDVQVNEQTGNFDTFTVVLSKLSFVANGKTNNIDLNGGLAVILDSGTTLTYLPNDIATSIYDGLGITYDAQDGAYVPCNVDTSNMQFAFTFGSDDGVVINVDLGQFVLPYSAEDGLPASNGGQSCVFGLLPTGQVSNGQGDILFGDTFLRSVYLVYDLDNNQIGMAQTKFDVSDSAVKDIPSAATSQLNTIPGATTVTDPASLSQANTEFAEPTLGGAASNTAEATNAAATSVSATYQGLASGGLQTGTTVAGGAAATSKAAASSVRAPAADLAGFLTIGMASLVALVAGSAFMMTM